MLICPWGMGFLTIEPTHELKSVLKINHLQLEVIIKSCKKSLLLLSMNIGKAHLTRVVEKTQIRR